MYEYTHTHTLPPPLNMISSYVCTLHISQQAEIHPPTQTHSKSTPKHSNAPSTKYSGRTTIHYLSISPNGWIIHYNSRNDNQLCVINMEYHTHHTKPTTPCTYLSLGTYASGDEIHVLLRCELQITLTHPSKHRRGIVALYYIDCCRRCCCCYDSEHGRGNSSVNSSIVSFQIITKSARCCCWYCRCCPMENNKLRNKLRKSLVILE